MNEGGNEEEDWAYMFRCSVMNFTLRLICGVFNQLSISSSSVVSEILKLWRASFTHIRDHDEVFALGRERRL
jgi:hypothetical protein